MVLVGSKSTRVARSVVRARSCVSRSMRTCKRFSRLRRKDLEARLTPREDLGFSFGQPRQVSSAQRRSPTRALPPFSNVIFAISCHLPSDFIRRFPPTFRLCPAQARCQPVVSPAQAITTQAITTQAITTPTFSRRQCAFARRLHPVIDSERTYALLRHSVSSLRKLCKM